MRLEAQVKAGYYAIPPEALNVALERLELRESSSSHPILDPCAGEGRAIQQLAQGLGIPEGECHLVELNAARGERCRELMPEARVLAPASLAGCSIQSGCFSLVYCNPPFDTAVGGGRMEAKFLIAALHGLAPGGILVFVAPERTQKEEWFSTNMLQFCDNLSALFFPPEVRKYNEMIFIAERRSKMADFRRRRLQEVFAPRNHRYLIPPATGPGKRFIKTGPTDDEVIEALERSPLNKLLQAPKPWALESPPMQLGTGHLALLLASGYLDGLVQPEGEPPHVVRGVARKTQVLQESTEEQTGKKERTTKDIYTERIDLVVRAIDASGVIRTFSSGGPDGSDNVKGSGGSPERA